jgi:hypothetical protein
VVKASCFVVSRLLALHFSLGLVINIFDCPSLQGACCTVLLSMKVEKLRLDLQVEKLHIFFIVIESGTENLLLACKVSW